jgi:hypothetical protein
MLGDPEVPRDDISIDSRSVMFVEKFGSWNLGSENC